MGRLTPGMRLLLFCIATVLAGGALFGMALRWTNTAAHGVEWEASSWRVLVQPGTPAPPRYRLLGDAPLEVVKARIKEQRAYEAAMEAHARHRMRWNAPKAYLPGWHVWGGYLSVNVPFWFLAALVLTWLVTALGLIRLTRRKQHQCAACGYDRRGLRAGAACPECGAGPQRGGRNPVNGRPAGVGEEG
jgi:hypothetical protein